jgi:hypothetical protein
MTMAVFGPYETSSVVHHWLMMLGYEDACHSISLSWSLLLTCVGGPYCILLTANSHIKTSPNLVNRAFTLIYSISFGVSLIL